MESLIIERIQYVVDKTDVNSSDLTPIQEFYKDAKVLVTGATGFLGQVLVEKLLRSCPVSTLYLLVRGKKGKDADTRLKDVVNNDLFRGLRKIRPDFMKQLVVVDGDCALPGLGLSVKDKKLLIDEVNIIFHVAASLRFDEKLKLAVPVNVRATRDLSQMAQQMSNLKSFVQVSTAFSNCVNSTIEEKVYEAPAKYTYVIEVAEKVDSLLLDNMTPYLIGNYPNTYIYTKQIGEDAFKHETQGLAAGIYRPSVVVSTFKQPVRGWINNIYGATGVLLGAGIGVLKVLYCSKDNAANIVPADMCVNGLVAAAWDVAEKFKKAKEMDGEFEVPVYHYESTNDKPISWGDFRKISARYALMIPTVKAVWVYFIFLVKSYKQYLVLEFFLHLVPAMLVDTVLYLKGRKTRMVSVYRKIHSFSSLISYFSVGSFNFQSFNVQNMLKRMTSRDRDIFFCDLKMLNWEEFFTTYGTGVRIYLLKDPLETMRRGKRHAKRLKYLHSLVVTTLGSVVLLTLSAVMFTVFKYVFM